MPDIGQREVTRGSAWGIAAFALTTATGPLVAVLLVRAMNHRQYGALALGADGVGILAVVCALGLGHALTQLSITGRSKAGADGELSAVRAVWKVAAAASAAAVVGSGLMVLTYELVVRLQVGLVSVVVLTPVALLAPLNSVLMGLCRTMKWPRLLAAAQVASGLAVAAGVLTLVSLVRPDAPIVAGLFDLRPIVLAAVLSWPARRWWRQCRKLGSAPPLAGRRVVSVGASFALAMLFGSLVAQLDVLVLGAFHGAIATGLYAPASAVGSFAVLVPLVVGSFYQPAVTRLIADRRTSDVNLLYTWSARVSLALAAPVLALLLVCPAALLSFVFGPAITVSATPLRILGIGAAVTAAAGFNSVTLDSYGLVRLTTTRLLVLIALAIAACFCLIPVLGATGAAWATTAAILAENALCSYLLWRRQRLVPWDRRVAAVSLAFAVSLVVGVGLVRAVPGPLFECGAVAVETALITWGVLLSLSGRTSLRSLLRPETAIIRADAEQG